MSVLRFLMIGMLFVSLTSCKKERTYNAGHFVGDWTFEQTGSFTLYHAGQEIGAIPVDGYGTSVITKSGKNGILIDNQLFTLSGHEITAMPYNEYETKDGVNMVGTNTFWGTVSHSIIAINSSSTGTWSNSYGEQGTYSARRVITLKRKPK